MEEQEHAAVMHFQRITQTLMNDGSDPQFTRSILLNFSQGPFCLAKKIRGGEPQKGLKMMPRQRQGKFSCNSHTDMKNHMDKKGLQTVAALTSPHAAPSPEIKHWSTTMRTGIPEFNFDDKRRGRSIALHLQSKHLELFPLPSHH